MTLALSKVYAQLPPSMIRRGVTGWVGRQNISTANLRKALRMKHLDRLVKNRLYDIYMYRRQTRRRK